jgi:hypothetical protein
MKNYLEARATNPYSYLQIDLRPIGQPNVRIITPHDIIDYPGLSGPIILEYRMNILMPYNITVELYDKHYTTKYETAVIIDKISVDNINIIPRYDYLAKYINDHDNNNPTNYLGFNGKWSLTIDQPFYQWLHEHSGQGWLLG